MNIVVREGTIFDVPPMVAVGKMMHEESDFAGCNWSDQKITKFGDRAVSDPDFCFFIVEVDEEPVGMIIGKVSPFFFGDDLQLHDYLWYVAPEHRGASAGAKLIEAYVEFGKAKGVQQVGIKISTNVTTGKTGKLLEKLNFVHVGGMFRHKV